MDSTIVLVLSTAGLLLLIAAGVPIAFALCLAATAGIIMIGGMPRIMYVLGSFPVTRLSSATLACIPLFVLMGALTYVSGAAADAYAVAYKWTGRVSGGLVLVSLGGCALVAATTGVGVTGTVAIGSIAIPEMRRYNYDVKLAVGALAAGGTLGVLIPPSIIMVIYGIATDTSIGALLIAGIIPGILLTLIYMAMVYIRCRINPKLAPKPERSFTFKEKMSSLVNAWGTVLVFGAVIGGLYAGVATPTEIGAIGSFVGLVMVFIAIARGRSDWAKLKNAFVDTARLCAMIFMLLLGGGLFALLVTMSGAVPPIVKFFTGLPLPPILLFLIISSIYIPLGMFVDGISMILITVPIIYPIVVQGMGYDPIWLGVILVVMTELGALTPPMGMQLFVVKGLFPDMKFEDILRGCYWFMAMDLVAWIILSLFPILSTWLPSMMR